MIPLLQGILPPVLLAVLMMLLPIVLRLLARFEGIPKYTGLELSLMTRFFIFQVIVNIIISFYIFLYYDALILMKHRHSSALFLDRHACIWDRGFTETADQQPYIYTINIGAELAPGVDFLPDVCIFCFVILSRF